MLGKQSKSSNVFQSMWFSHLDKSLTRVCMSNHQCTIGDFENFRDGCWSSKLMLLCTPENVKLLHTKSPENHKSYFIWFYYYYFSYGLFFKEVFYVDVLPTRLFLPTIYVFLFLNMFGWGWTLNMQTSTCLFMLWLCLFTNAFCISYHFCSCRVDICILNKGNGMSLHSSLLTY